MNASEDVVQGNIIAIHLSDYDARIWGRRFDIAQVTEVTEVGGEKAFNILYYAAEGIQPWRNRLGTEEFFAKEKRSIDGEWSLTEQKAATYPDNVMCYCWVQDDGKIDYEHKHILQEAILAHESL